MRVILAGVLLLSPWAVFAAGSFIDAYYTPSAKLEITHPSLGSGDDDGEGFGVRGLAPVAEGLALTAEYQSIRYDDSDLDLEQLRFGAGLVGPSGAGLFAEYVELNLDEEESADGYGIHARFASRSGTAGLFGQIGYVSVDDDAETNKGIEYSLGLAIPINAQWAGMADYRRTKLEGEDSRIETQLSEFRVGLRMSF